MSLTPAVKQHLDDLTSTNNVVLFMKGTRSMPQCGFSATVVGILDEYLDDYTTVNVLDDMAIREGIKQYTNWPTIPQLYVKGEFVGGCDIVRQLQSQGELDSMFGAPAEINPPAITITPEAGTALREAMGDHQGALRLEVTAQFEYNFSFGEPGERDLTVEVAGFKLVLDRSSAKRIDGATIGFVTGAEGAGLRVDNPNEPPTVKQLSVHDLKAWLDKGDDFTLFDVRSDEEYGIAHIGGSILLDEGGHKVLEGLDKDATIVFHCHHGGRSQQAANHFLNQGYRNVFNLAGGVDAWSREVDSTVSRY